MVPGGCDDALIFTNGRAVDDLRRVQRRADAVPLLAGPPVCLGVWSSGRLVVRPPSLSLQHGHAEEPSPDNTDIHSRSSGVKEAVGVGCGKVSK
jgi:hypothetical protein